MSDLDRSGKERIIDTPVSENGCTGAAIGASLCGYRPIMIHPVVIYDFSRRPARQPSHKWSCSVARLTRQHHSRNYQSW